MEIPNRIKCAYCIRNRAHGGECGTETNPSDEKGCLAFKLDERGCIRKRDTTIPLPLYHEIPMVGVWCGWFEISGISTEVRINKIHGISWDSKGGNVLISCNIDFFINEYTDNSAKTGIPILKRIK